MTNIFTLKNVPKEFYTMLNALSRKYNKKSFDIFMSDRHQSRDLDVFDHNRINSFLPYAASASSFNVIKNALETAHIDRQRKSALQIAIDSNPIYHFAYAVKSKYVDKIVPKISSTGNGFINKIDTEWTNQIKNDMPMFYWYDPRYYDHVAVEPYKAYFCNTVLPHGGLHIAYEKPRYFFSLSFLEPIDEIAEKFKDWL